MRKNTINFDKQAFQRDLATLVERDVFVSETTNYLLHALSNEIIINCTSHPHKRMT